MEPEREHASLALNPFQKKNLCIWKSVCVARRMQSRLNWRKERIKRNGNNYKKQFLFSYIPCPRRFVAHERREFSLPLRMLQPLDFVRTRCVGSTKKKLYIYIIELLDISYFYISTSQCVGRRKMYQDMQRYSCWYVPPSGWSICVAGRTRCDGVVIFFKWWIY